MVASTPSMTGREAPMVAPWASSTEWARAVWPGHAWTMTDTVDPARPLIPIHLGSDDGAADGAALDVIGWASPGPQPAGRS